MPTSIPFIPGPKQYRIDVPYPDQAALTALVGPRRQEELRIKVRARLLQDDTTEVQVSINGLPVGYLSCAHTRALDRIVRYGARSAHESFECAALIHGTAGQLGVRLDLPIGD